MSRNPTPLHPIGDERGFTVIEVLAAVVVLISGIVALLGMLVVGNHATAANRERQAATSLAREVIEDVRSLPYSEMVGSSLPGTLQSLLPSSSLSGSNVLTTRSGGSGGQTYSFSVSVTECSLDDSSDGYGSHTLAPESGGSWCPDVASSGATDTNPDDYKRVVVKVTPSTNTSLSSVQQSILVYSRPTNGPAISCLTQASPGTCPGANISVTSTSTTALTFSITATQTPAAVEWLVNGSVPASSQIPSGSSDPYSTSSKTSTFTWNFPTTSTPSGTGTIDGTYTIGAISYDANGNAGTESTLQVKLNEHQAIAPSSLTAGWNAQLNGVDIAWTPSVDQDIQYYNVYHKYGSSGPALLACSHVTGTSCYDLTAITPNPGSEPTCTSSNQTYAATSNNYYVVGVDTDSTGAARESTWQSPSMDADLCDHPPNRPSGLTATSSGGTVTLNWSKPTDPDSWDSIGEYRIYRWTNGPTLVPGSRYDLVGATDGSGNSVTKYSDSSADPSGVTQNYCVTAVDTHLDESQCSGTASG